MTIVNQSVLVPYTPSEMFDLVDDIEKYHEFLPWCISSDVHSRDEHEVRATLKVGTEGIHKAFTTSNRRHPRDRIEMNLVEGPFRHLQGAWMFEAKQETSCEISLSLEFEFSSRLMALAFGRVFNTAVNSMIDAFKKRAREVYGERENES